MFLSRKSKYFDCFFVVNTKKQSTFTNGKRLEAMLLRALRGSLPHYSFRQLFFSKHLNFKSNEENYMSFRGIARLYRCG